MIDKNNSEFDKSESTLFGTADEKPAEIRKKTNSMKKQRRAIIILAAVVAAALLAYFFIVVPIVNYVEETPDEEIELLDGEVLGTNNRILLFEHLERDDIASIEVFNNKGGYAFKYDKVDDQFYIKGHASAPYDSTLFSSLVVNAGYTIVTERIHTDCEDMSEYGLANEQSPAYFTVTARTGEAYTVYIGDMTPSGTGYYVRCKGRNAVYILDSDIGKTMFASLEDMVTPMLALPMAQNDYFMIEKFTLMRGKEIALQISYLDEEAQAAAAATTAYKMLAPADYAVNNTNYLTALESIMNFTGTSTLVYAPTAEELAEYGLAEPASSIHYNYQGIDQSIVFSEKNENGNYYAYSLLFDLITEVNGTTLAWLEWDTIKWVDKPIFMMNINDIKSIVLDSTEGKYTFELVGVDKELTVSEKSAGTLSDVSNFRKFYRVLISTYMENYVSSDLTADEVSTLEAEENLYLTMTIETRAGKITEFKFYPYSTRRAYYTVNGEGEFYVLRDRVTKIVTDAAKVIAGELVDPDAHS